MFKIVMHLLDSLTDSEKSQIRVALGIESTTPKELEGTNPPPPLPKKP